MRMSVFPGVSRFALAISVLALSGPASALSDTGYTYDALGRLQTTTYSNGTVVTYTYDPAGNRTQKAVAAVGSSFSQTIQVTGSGPVNLRTLANSQGYNGAQNATITFEVANAVTIMGDPGGGIGIDTGTWPTGFTITLALVVKSGGKVFGGGGNGGSGGSTFYDFGLTSGGAGGDGVYARVPIAITIQSGGAIAGGGNGGDGGHGSDYYDPDYGDTCWGGGGGGGGWPNGAGGPGGGDAYTYQWTWCYPGYTGNDGTTSSGGYGGFAADGSPSSNGNGGLGGNPGGGYAIRKNGNTVSVSNSGSVTGTVS